MKKKVVILSRSFGEASTRPQKRLEEMGFNVTISRNDYPENEEAIASKIGDADAVIVGSDVISKQVIECCPNLKIISKHGVGLDNIDIESAEKHGIKVCNAVGSNSETVADFTILLMLAALRKLRSYEMSPIDLKWKKNGLSQDLFDKTVGIIGYGRIGKAVARRLKGFKCKVLAYDTHPLEDDVNCIATDFEEIIREADIISLHTPLNNNTRHIIGASELRKMKENAVLINTARGSLVDENAVYEALVNGQIAAFGTDVFTEEPPISNPLLTLENVIATPHIATHTKESNYRMGSMAVNNIIDFFNSI